MHFAFRELRTSLVTVLAVLAVLAATLGILGCERQIAPPLVEVTEIAPREVEPGDRLEIRGAGFPQGRVARITLEGTVYRPGEMALHGLSVDVEGTVATPDRLEVVVRDMFAERMCGHGDHAAHATFEGDVHVAFASSNSGAPPLVGHLRGAHLDVLPSSVRASVLEERVNEGTRVLAFLGVTPGAPTPQGLPIEQVEPGSLAHRSALQVGDVISSVDGVHVLTLGDVIPASARTIDLTIRHGDSGSEETKTLPMVEFSGERVPTEYAPALIIVGLAIAMLVFLVLPGPPSLGALEMQIAARIRRKSLPALLYDLVGRGRVAGPLSVLVTAVLATFALTPYVMGPEIDGVVLLAGAASMLVWSRLAMTRGFFASLRTLLQAMTAILVVAGCLALAIMQVGAIELAEIVRVQGGAPWQFAAARHPSCTVAALTCLVALITVLRAQPAPATTTTKAAAHQRLLERAGVLLASALFVTVFLGGWQVPGVEPHRLRSALFLSTLCFVVKTWVVFAVVVASSRVATHITMRDLTMTVLRRFVPALLVSAGFLGLARKVVPSSAIETALGATLVALASLFVVRLALRVYVARSKPEPHASPFL